MSEHANSLRRKELVRKWRDEEAAAIEASKQRMADELGLERNDKFEIAWRIAWDQGHSAGFSEIENYFRELADLLKPSQEK